MCLLAQDCVFEEAERLLLQFFGIEMSGKQIQRVSEHYGGRLEESERAYREETEKVREVPVVSKAGKEAVYVMIDGSMVYTREDGWKEMKVGKR